MNTVDKLNTSIADFVSRPENAVLRPATGGYSTPFRGQLFGHQSAADVESKLRGRRVDLLFLGSNPNCPGSLDLLRSQSDSDGHWPEFQEQVHSGYFGERVVDHSGAVRAWDPIHNTASMGAGQQASWTFYTKAFQGGGASLDAVAMANVFSWGSGQLNDLVRHLEKHDSKLFDRVVEFANDQLRLIIAALKPRLIVCPKSVSDHSSLRQLLMSRTRIKDMVDVRPTGLEGQDFQMNLGSVLFDGHSYRVLLINHPSGLRFHRKVDRPKIAAAIADAIKCGMDPVTSSLNSV